MPDRITRFAIGTRLGFFVLLGISIVPGLIGGLYLLSTAQAKYFPVVNEFTVDIKSLDTDGNIIMSGSFVKLYPEWFCKYTGLKWYMPTVTDDNRVTNLRVEAEYDDVMRSEDDNNRPDGLQKFYGWRIFTSRYPNSHYVTGYVTHDCGIGPLKIGTRTDLPMIDLPTY